MPIYSGNTKILNVTQMLSSLQIDKVICNETCVFRKVTLINMDSGLDSGSYVEGTSSRFTACMIATGSQAVYLKNYEIRIKIPYKLEAGTRYTFSFIKGLDRNTTEWKSAIYLLGSSSGYQIFSNMDQGTASYTVNYTPSSTEDYVLLIFHIATGYTTSGTHSYMENLYINGELIDFYFPRVSR